jgi:hypothetical protein
MRPPTTLKAKTKRKAQMKKFLQNRLRFRALRV